MSFATVINCMDGRVQFPVLEWVRSHCGTPHVDSITDPGPILRLSDPADADYREAICTKLAISIDKHGSRRVFVVGHHDCAGNPAGREEQLEQIRTCIANLADRFPRAEFAGLYVNDAWTVETVAAS